MLGPMAVELAEDRKQRNHEVEVDLVRRAALVLAVVPVVLALIAGAATRNVLVALLVLVVVAGGLGAWAWTTVRGYGARVVARPGGTPVSEQAQPRLHNLVDGLCVAHGVAKPALIGVAGPGRNIASVTVGTGASATTALIVSEPLLESLSRIELEGVIAQQLSQFQDGSSSLTTLVAAIGSTPGLGAVLRGTLAAASDPDRQVLADLAGVRLTRYPPGLASALESLASGSTEIAVADAATAPLWLADPLPARPATEDDPPSLEVRAAMLRER
jgi:heat shock protein HtpX